MNLDEIKEIIEKDKGKFIIVEDGKPTMVILSFDDYKKILKINPEKKIVPEPEREMTSLEVEEKLTPEVNNYRESLDGEGVWAPLHGISKEEEFPGEFSEEQTSAEAPAGEEIPEELEEEPLKIEDLPI